MANAFDQFDTQAPAPSPAPAANPFDQFDAQPAQAPFAASPQAAPTSTPFGDAVNAAVAQANAQDASDDAKHSSLLGQIADVISNYGNAAAHHLANIPVGIAQGVTNLADKAADLISPSPSPTLSTLITGQNSPRTGVAGALDSATNNINQYAGQREANYQFQQPDGIATDAGATASEVAPWLVGLGEARAAGLIPEYANVAKTAPDAERALALLKNAAIGSGEGAAIAATQPVTNNDGNYFADKGKQILTGGLVGAGAAPVGAIVKGLAGAAAAPFQQVGGAIQHALDPQAVADANVARLLGNDQGTIDTLANAKPSVPGTIITAAEALPSPQAVQAERMLRNNPVTGPTLAAQDVANNNVRLQQIQGLAGTPDDYANSVADRNAVVQPWIAQNLSDSRPVTRWQGASQAFSDALNKPMTRDANFQALQQAQKVVSNVMNGSMQEDDGIEALKELGDSVSQKYAPIFDQANAAINNNMVNPTGVLKTLATIRNGPLGLATDNATGSNVGAQLDQLANGISRSTNINGLIGTDMLDAVRQNASRMLGNAGGQGAVALGPARQSIVNAIDKVVPGYKQYLSDYGTMSQPLTDMNAASEIINPDRGGAPNSGGQLQLTAARINQALRANADAQYPVSQNMQQLLQNIRDSLNQRSIADNKIAASGPSTAADMQAALQPNNALSSAIYGSNLTRAGGPIGRLAGAAIGTGLGALGGPITAAGGGLIGGAIPDALGAANQRVLQRVANALSNSQEAAAAIQRANARATPGAIRNALATLPSVQTPTTAIVASQNNQ